MKTASIYFVRCFIVIFACIISSVGVRAQCYLIDFETITGDVVEDNLEISDQYLATNGVSFILEDGTYPHIAKFGDPITAFASAIGEFMYESEEVGAYFLTDDGELTGLITSPLFMNFSTPMDSVSGAILDIDFQESFTIEARDELDSVITTVVIMAGDPGTGDAEITPWGIKSEEREIHSLKIIGEREISGAFGFAFDNFLTCPVDAEAAGLLGTTSTSDLVINQTNIYPNPSTGNIVIEFNNDEVVNSVELFDAVGRSLNFNSSTESHLTKVECDHQGVVFIRIQVGDDIITQKLFLK